MDRRENKGQFSGVQIANPDMEQESLAEKVAEIQKRSAAKGMPSSGEDLKAFMDEMWGED